MKGHTYKLKLKGLNKKNRKQVGRKGQKINLETGFQKLCHYAPVFQSYGSIKVKAF